MTSDSVDSGLWIRQYHPAPGSRTQLVCFPHAGGSASFYFPLSLSLTPSVEVLSIQYPGRQDRRTERCLEDIQELADHALAALRPRLSAPVAFFGHSMGAVIAYEVARRLEAESDLVLAALFASGRRAPSTYRHEAVHRQGEARIIAELRALRGTSEAMLDDGELLQMILPAIRSDYRAIEQYRHRPGPALRCPVTVLVGDSDPRTSLEEAEAWRSHTTGAFDMRVFPGGHFYLVEASDDVIKAVATTLADSRGLRPSG